jgi:NAD(P)-dependent dehydrogenase (short-subunit alcohol dehydrogenase family)
MMTADLAGRVALVTGAASGIGRATAVRLATHGARVVVADRDRGGGEQVVAAIRDAGGEAHFVLSDVSEPTAVDALVATTVRMWGRLDCAHNNAGVLGPVGDLLECSLEDYEQVMRVNVTGVWLCLKAQIRQMLSQDTPPGGHAIVNTASVAGLVGSPLIAAYSASKHAVVGLTRSAARAYGGRGIRVNCVCPGPIETPLSADLFAAPGARERLLNRQSLPHLADPESVAAAVTWLCSPDAAMVTGAALPVDAGALA